jgi:hypothetical protein
LKIFANNHEGKKKLVKIRHNLEKNIIINFKEIFGENVKLVQVNQDTGQ